MDKSILSNTSSSVNSSASSNINVVTPCNDLRFAVCVPLLVLIPLKIILLPVLTFRISSFVIAKSLAIPSSSIFSINSGIILTCADTNV